MRAGRQRVYPQVADFPSRESDLTDIVMRMVLRGWGVRVVAVGVAVGVLAGCTGDPEPQVTPTPSPTPTESLVESPSPTPSPSPTALTEEEILAAIPEEARQENFWGAQEFSRFFLENYHEMIQERPDLFTALSDEGCVFCERTERYFEEIGVDGRSFEGGDVEVTSQLAKGGRQEDGTWGVIVDINSAPLVERDVNNQVLAETPGGPGVATLLLEFNGHWSVLEVAAESE